MSELQKLTVKRGYLKAQLSKFVTFLERYDETKLENLRLRWETIEGVFSEFHQVQVEIETLDEDVDNEAAHCKARDDFENTFFEAGAKARALLRLVNSSTPVVRSDSQNLFNASVIEPRIKLPTLTLPIFHGKYEDWPQFRDSFQAIVGNNSQITNCQKLQYLRAQVRAEAAKAIHSLDISNDNFEIAWKILTERFENKKLSVFNHIKEIFDIPVITKENSVQLRELYDTLQKNVRCLRSLKVPIDEWDLILIYIVRNKLDSESRRGWESVICENDLPNFKELSSYLNERCQLLECLQNTSSKNRTPEEKGHRKKDVSCTSVSHTGCAICNGSHKIEECNTLKDGDVDARIREIKQRNLCFNCLKKGHGAYYCRAARCGKCQRRHHILLHEDANVSERGSKLPRKTTRKRTPKKTF